MTKAIEDAANALAIRTALGVPTNAELAAVSDVADAAYVKPVDGIPHNDLHTGIRDQLDLADTALQPGALPVGTTVTAAQISDAGAAGRTLLQKATLPEIQSLVSGYKLLNPSGDSAADTAALVAALAVQNAKIKIRGDWVVTQPLLIADGVTVDAWTATLSQAFAGNLLRNTQALTASGRNKNIQWYGGTLNRGANGGSNLDLHTNLFVGVDGLVFWPEKITSSAGKYSVYLCDVKNFDVGNIEFASASDGVHMLHKCIGGYVHDITGTTGDDSVAITVYDYSAYNISTRYGTTKNIRINNIRTTTTKNGVKVLGGKNVDTATYGVATGIHVSNVIVSAAEAALTVFGDNANAWTTGGDIGYVRAENIENTGGGHAVTVSGESLTIQTLDLLNIYAPQTAYKYPLYLAGGFVANKIRVADSKLSPQAGTIAINCAAITGWPTVKKLVIDGVDLAVATKTAGLLANNNASTAIKQLILRNYHVSRAAWGIGDFYGNVEIVMDGVTSDTSATVGGMINARAGATITISGAAGYSPTVTTVANAGTVASKSFGFLADISTVSRAAGAMATNTNAALSCGAGPVICDGSTWKNLYTGATY